MIGQFIHVPFSRSLCGRTLIKFMMLAGIKERRKRATLRSTSTACKRNEGRPCVLTPRNATIIKRPGFSCLRNGNEENIDKQRIHDKRFSRFPEQIDRVAREIVAKMEEAICQRRNNHGKPRKKRN